MNTSGVLGPSLRCTRHGQAGATAGASFRDAGSGFTLVELLVSVTLLAVVISAISSALYAGILVWERAGAYDARRIETMIALERFEEEVRSAFILYAVPFKGSDSEVRFAGYEAGSAAREGTLGWPICEVVYAYDSGSNTFQRSSRAFPFQKLEDPVCEPVISGLKEVRLSYADKPHDRSSREPVWRSSWKNTERLPAAVKITFEFDEDGRRYSIERTICLAVLPGEGEPKGADDADESP